MQILMGRSVTGIIKRRANVITISRKLPWFLGLTLIVLRAIEGCIECYIKKVVDWNEAESQRIHALMAESVA